MTRAHIATLAGMASQTANWDDEMRGAMTTLRDATAVPVSDYGTTADAGTALNAAIAALTSGGTIYVPPGTWTIDTPVVLKTGIRIVGAGRASVLQANGVDMFSIPTSLCDGAEIGWLKLDATGGHVFSGFRHIRCWFHDLEVLQNSAGFSILSDTAMTLMTSNTFERCIFRAYGATRTVPAINLATAGIDLIGENKFIGGQFWHQDGSDDVYFVRIISSHATSMVRNTTFERIAWEKCNGGGIYMESANTTRVIDCHAWDMTSLSLKANFYDFRKNTTNSHGCENLIIHGCTRVGDGPDTGIQDLHVDSNGTNVIVHGVFAQASGVTWRTNLNSATNTSVLP